MFELVAHYITCKTDGFVSYPERVLQVWSWTLFTVMLGVGLDRIANQFQWTVGEIGFGEANYGLALSFVVIIFGQFLSVLTLVDSLRNL